MCPVKNLCYRLGQPLLFWAVLNSVGTQAHTAEPWSVSCQPLCFSSFCLDVERMVSVFPCPTMYQPAWSPGCQRLPTAVPSPEQLG